MNEATEDSNNTPEGVQEDNSKDTQEQAAVQETAAQPVVTQISPKRVIVQFLSFLKDRLNLSDDQATPEETSDYIRKGVEFNGPNVWILIFAIFIASVGLNMNSTAVVIGAMLISPLMGPIMGIGLGLSLIHI